MNNQPSPYNGNANVPFIAKPPTVPQPRECLFVILTFALCLLTVNVFWLGPLPRLGIPLLLLIAIALFFLYAGRPLAQYNRSGLLLLAASVANALPFVLNANTALYPIRLLLVQLLAAIGITLAVSPSAGGLATPTDAAHAGGEAIRRTFTNVNKPVRVFFGLKIKGTVAKVLTGLLIAVPVVIVVVVLLSSADTAFGKAIVGIFGSLAKWNSDRVPTVIFALLLTFPLFSFLYSNRHADSLNPLQWQEKRTPQSDGVIVLTIIALLCLLYAFFAAFQMTYLFANRPPVGFSYSDYARRGFFELTAVTAINVVLLLSAIVSIRPDGRGYKLLKLLGSAMLALTLVILASAVYRMVLYVQAGGFTLLRFLVFWGELVMLLTLVMTAIKLWRPRVHIFRALTGLWLGGFLLLNLCNIDARIADINVALHNSGHLPNIDLEYMSTLSIDAVPALQRLPASDQCGDAIRSIQLHEKEQRVSLWDWHF